MEQAYNGLASEKQKAFLRDLCNDTGIAVPRELDSMTSAAATAQIDQLKEIRHGQSRQRKAARQPLPATPATAEKLKGNGWSEGNYSPYRLGMCFKLAVETLNTFGIRPEQNHDKLVDMTVELYGLSLKAEREAIRLHSAGGATGAGNGGDEE